MLTIFTSARPFTDPHISIIQRNAIKSWTLLSPKCEIIILGDEEGVEEIAKEFGIIHIPHVKKNSAGKPLKSAVFFQAIKRATYRLVCFINADIILMDDFLPAVQRIPFKNFLLAGKRYDIDITKPLDFNNFEWRIELRARVKKEGKMHGPSALDYVVFSKNTDLNMPPFAMNRGGWDNWIVGRFKSLGAPVVDGTGVITSIHQNHPMRIIKNLWRSDPQARKELRLAGGFSSFLTLREADYILTAKGLMRAPYPRRLLSQLAYFKIWRNALALKRWVYQYMS